MQPHLLGFGLGGLVKVLVAVVVWGVEAVLDVVLKVVRHDSEFRRERNRARAGSHN